MADDLRKTQLTSELERSRASIARTLGNLHSDLDVPRHVKNNFRTHKTAWIGGAAAIGWVLARLPGRTKKTGPVAVESGGLKPRQTERHGLLFSVAKLLFSAARPALTAYATKKITELATARTAPRR